MLTVKRHGRVFKVSRATMMPWVACGEDGFVNGLGNTVTEAIEACMDNARLLYRSAWMQGTNDSVTAGDASSRAHRLEVGE